MWVLAAEAAVHVYNRTPHKGINFQTPLSVLNSEKNHHLGELKRFGCIAYIRVPLPENKFSDRANNETSKQQTNQEEKSSQCHKYKSSKIAREKS